MQEKDIRKLIKQQDKIGRLQKPDGIYCPMCSTILLVDIPDFKTNSCGDYTKYTYLYCPNCHYQYATKEKYIQPHVIHWGMF